MRTTKLVLGWFCVAALAACGGSTVGVDGDGDSGGGGGEGGSTDGGGTGGDGSTTADSGGDGGGTHQDSGNTSTGCPTSAPSSGACSPVGLECEYGNNANPGCDSIVDCTQNGWQEATGENCSGQGTCPTTYDAVPKNQDCTPDGFSCGYSDGQCNCAPVAMSAHQSPVWQCTPTTAGCPAPRPDLGTVCSVSSSTTCDYGACNGGVAEVCVGGHWQRAQTACPASQGQ